MAKLFTRFDPVPTRTREQCERHYTGAHIPFAQDQLRAMPGLVSYHVNRADAEADLAGGFTTAPTAWRFVVLRFEGDAGLSFSPEQAEAVAQDHRNFLCRLRSCRVEESVVWDRVAGQLALAKFVIEVDRRPAPGASRKVGSGADSSTAVADLVAAVGQRMERGFGSRLLLANRVLAEGRAEPIDHEGQRATGEFGPSDKLAYLECYFDHARWGREVLGPVRAELGASWNRDAECRIYQVVEHCPLDLRT